MPSRKKSINPPLHVYKKLAISFVVLTLILIAVIFYFTLSYAYVTVYPKPQEVSTDFNFLIAEDESLQNEKEGLFKGEIINQTFEGEKKVATTGTKNIYTDVVGKVKIINDLSSDQILIQKTRLLTPDGILFRIRDRVTVPGGGSIETFVYPDDSTKPLATVGTKFTLPGLSESLQKLIYAEALDDFSAEGVKIKAIAQGEFEQAVAAYSKELAQQVFAEDNADKVKILTQEVIDKQFSNKLGDEVDEFTVKLKVKVIGVMFDGEPVRNFAKQALESVLNIDKELLSDTSDQLIYEVENYDLDNKLVKVKSSVKGIAIISENSDILDRNKLIKLKLDEIKAYLENFDDIEKVEVGFFPSWLKKIPRFQDHIIIKIEKYGD